jgi:transcriptional regulator with XRE-family HTH domain
MNEGELAQTSTKYQDKPMTQEEKPTLATHITKHARHQLVRFCLTSIRSEYDDMPLTRKTRRGRPPSPENRLASRLGVSTRTVRRWSSGQEAIQSSDENAEKLAALAYVYNQEETILLLREDAERARARGPAPGGFRAGEHHVHHN